MPRKPRVHFPGAVYHVMCRGNNREPVLSSEIDKRSYLSLLRDYKDRYRFRLYAWVVMSNHAHMLMEVGHVPLSKIMQGIQQSYTGRYNHFNSRTGHVFEQRYKAFLCHHESHMLSVMRYIHQNPAQAGLEDGLNYEYSSHQAYLNHQHREITDTSYPLSLFSSDAGEARLKYLEYLMQEGETTVERTAPALGEQESLSVDSNTISRPAIFGVPLPQILDVVADQLCLEAGDITGPSRLRELVNARRVLVQLCLRNTVIPQCEVAKLLGVSEPAISKMVRTMPTEVNQVVEQMLRKLRS